MNNNSLNNFINQQDWLVYYEADNPDRQDIISSLAYEDSFIRSVADLNDQSDRAQAILHLYPIPIPSVYLGAKDRRLDQVDQANQYLLDQGYQIALRPHGGLGIINDEGTTNLSLIFDRRHYDHSIDQAYELFVTLMQEVVKEWGLDLEAYEIPNSYCPGKYDLVIHGKKVGGIAQRRFKSGISVAAYLSIQGDQARRAQVMRDYYQIGQAGPDYPQVDPAVMTTLSDELGQEISVAEFNQKVLGYFQASSRLESGAYQDPALASIYQKHLTSSHQKTQELLDKEED